MYPFTFISSLNLKNPKFKKLKKSEKLNLKNKTKNPKFKNKIKN